VGRLDEWRQRQERKARERAARFRELDGQLREVVETREIPRAAKADLPDDGTLPPEVAVLVDDGQVRRGVNLLANLCGVEARQAEPAVARYLRERRGADGA
jgi:hypothetical protein